MGKLAQFARAKSASYEAYLDHVNLRQQQHEKNTVFLNVHTPDYDALSCQVPRNSATAAFLKFFKIAYFFLAQGPLRKSQEYDEPDASFKNTQFDMGY